MELVNVIWDEKKYEEFRLFLYTLGNKQFSDFFEKINPGISSIGLKNPVMREIAKEIIKGDYHAFLNVCKPNCYEESFIEATVRATCKCSFEEHVKLFMDFVPKINNWGVCDCTVLYMKWVKKDLDAFYPYVLELLKGDSWSIRAGLVLLLGYYVNDAYIDRVLDIANSIDDSFYYVVMADAWLISVAYVHYPEKNKKMLDSNTLDYQIIQKAVQKIRDSFRVSPEDKEYVLKYRK